MANQFQDDQQYGQDGEAYDQQSSAGTPAPAAGGARKKRAYAGQAYEFGAGGNAALGGQPPAGGAPPMMPAGGAAPYGYPAGQPQPAYGMPQTPVYGDPAAQAPQAAAPYAQPAYGQPAGGYQPAAPGYPQQDMAGMTQQFGQMGMGGQTPQPAVQQQQVPQPAQRLNPLVPVDISMQGQPFHVSDLDQPPPPCILPPNVSIL